MNRKLRWFSSVYFWRRFITINNFWYFALDQMFSNLQAIMVLSGTSSIKHLLSQVAILLYSVETFWRKIKRMKVSRYQAVMANERGIVNVNFSRRRISVTKHETGIYNNHQNHPISLKLMQSRQSLKSCVAYTIDVFLHLFSIQWVIWCHWRWIKEFKSIT